MIVSVGSRESRDEAEWFKTKVEEAIVHQEFNDETYSNDFVILKLQDAVPAEKATPIGIARHDPPLDAKVAAVRWSYELHRRGIFMHEYKTLWGTLQHVDVPIVPNKECGEKLGPHKFDETVLCAGDASAGWGNRGMPLILEPRRGSWLSTIFGAAGSWLRPTETRDDDVLLGLMSRAMFDADRGVPAAYARVSTAVEFIEKHVPLDKVE
jgi:secreted trypsin-like serine protease